MKLQVIRAQDPIQGIDYRLGSDSRGNSYTNLREST